MSVFVHPQALVDTQAVGKGTRIWAFAHVAEGAAVGEDCNICEGCFLEKGSVVGNRVTLKNGVALWEGVTLEDDVFVGPHAAFTNDLYPRSRHRPEVYAKTRVLKGTSIGANATILCGLTIGAYAFIGAGAVVTKNVPDYALVLGNPARRQAYLCECRKKLRFSRKQAECTCGLRYQETSKGVEQSAKSIPPLKAAG